MRRSETILGFIKNTAAPLTVALVLVWAFPAVAMIPGSSSLPSQ
jgi:hypothetical protein